MQSPSLPRAMAHRLLALGFLVMFLSTSIKSLYQVYFSQLAAHFGTGRAGLAWSGSLFMLVMGLMSPVSGALCDRLGPLRTLLLGAIAAGLALAGASLASGSLPAFVLAYGIGAAFALASMTYVPMGMLVDRLFEQKKKGLAYAVVTNGTAVGFIVLSPFWLWLQPRIDWSTAFLATGLVLAGPVAALLAGAARAAAASGLAHARAASAAAPGAWRRVCADPGFYVLALGFLGCGATMAFVDVHLVPYWQDSGTSRARMGLSMSLLGVLELASGLASGWLAIRFNKRVLLGFFYGLRSLAMLMLLSSAPAVHTVGFAAVFGASYLGTVVLTSMYCFERYGAQVKGRVFGLLFLVHQFGAFVSVQFSAWSYDLSGSYRLAVTLLAGLSMAAAVANWVGLRRPSQDAQADPVAASL